MPRRRQETGTALIVTDQPPAEPDVSWPADKVERWPIGTLIPDAMNARTHSTEQIAALANSIQEWGWTNPALIDDEGHLIAGHGRVMAAHRLGIATVPVMIARGWTEAQKRAYALADNKLPEAATWDERLLTATLIGLQDVQFDVALTGFSPDEIDKLVRPYEPDVDADDIGRTRERLAQGQARQRLVDIDCPHCGAVFTVNRESL